MIRIEQELEYARIALTNGLNHAELQDILSHYGYPPERMQQGMALYQEALALLRQMIEARKAKVSATLAFYKAWRTARLLYGRDLATMRLLLRNDATLHYYLQLPGKRNASYAGWHAQACSLYEGIQKQPELQALLGPVGITLERVGLGLQALEAVQQARVVQIEQKGVAQMAIQRYADVRKRLNDWVDLFGISARKALATTPGHLTQLGLDVTLEQERRRKLALRKKQAETDQQTPASTALV
ncbi:MAG: hypothetical protein U0175_34550 [Caldilineaceae bacterium]